MTVLGPVITGTLVSMSNNGQLPLVCDRSPDTLTIRLGSRTIEMKLPESCGCDESFEDDTRAGSPLLYAILQDAWDDDPNQPATADGASNLSGTIVEQDEPNSQAQAAAGIDPTGIDFEPHTMPAEDRAADELAGSSEQETSDDQVASPETVQASDEPRPAESADTHETEEASSDELPPTGLAPDSSVTASTNDASGDAEHGDDSGRNEQPTQSPDQPIQSTPAESDSGPAEVALPTEPEFVLTMRSAVASRLRWLSAEVHLMVQELQP